MSCEECHLTPTHYRERGHIFDAQGKIDPLPAEVTFGRGARHGDRPSPPRYDPSGGACLNVYCHGGTLPDAATLPPPVWRTVTATSACAGCHRMPPTGHVSDRCGDCHGRVSDSSGALRDLSLHGDGRVDLGDGAGGCEGCHTLTDRGHVDHAEARRGLSAPVDCSGCHRVPTRVTGDGHIDTPLPAEVFPPGFEGAAAARGATPRYGSDGCADTACHGPAPLLWGGPEASVYCGSCHGIPPADADHVPPMTVFDCVTCHATSVGPGGNILFPAQGPPRHLNGVIDR